MIRLRVLGSVDLIDDGGRDVAAVLAQPKRLALLTYLVLARPPGFHRREVLLSLLWPQSDQGTARNSLRQALHFLRHALGDAVIVSRGEKDLAVDHRMLWCDAIAFDAALDDGNLHEAITLYRGDIMPGMVVADAPEFNRWLDEERDHFRHRVERALESAATDAENRGEHALAVSARRRSSALQPLSSRVALALMHTLAKAGDRAAAIQHAAAFTRVLLEELGIEGDNEVTAFAAELRGGRSSPRAEVEPQHKEVTALASEKLTNASRLTVLPFAVHGESAYQYLGHGMVDLLSRSLDGADTLRVVDPYAVIGLTSRSTPGAADPTYGSEVARRFLADLFVLGSVVVAHGRLQVFATLYHVERGRLITAEATVADEAALFQIVEDLTRQLLIGRVSPAQRLTRVAANLTPSIAALKNYLTGESFYRRGLFQPAREALERAVAEDPEFALAWYRLGNVLLWLQLPALALDKILRAVAVSERLHPQDRALLDAYLALLQGESRAGERLYRSILSSNPDNVEASLGLGLLLISSNPLRGRSSGESMVPLKRVLEIDPENGPARMHAAYVLAKEGRYDELLSSVRKWDEDNEFGIYPRAMQVLLGGTPREIESLLDELARAGEVTIYEAVRYVARLTHNLAGAQRVARLLTDPSRPPVTVARGHMLWAELAAGLGRHGDALDALADAYRLDPRESRAIRGLVAACPFFTVDRTSLDAMRSDLDVPRGDSEVLPEVRPLTAPHAGLHEAIDLYVLGHLHARVEDFDAALTTAERLASLEIVPALSGFRDDWTRGINAHIAWRQGRHTDALALLEGAGMHISYSQRFHSPFLSQNLERYLRAELLSLVGREEDAILWYECVSSDFVHEIVFLAPSYLRRAQIYDRRGDYARAREFYERFIALWREGEAQEIAAVTDAQRRLIRFGASSARG